MRLTGVEIKNTFEQYSRIDHTNFYCFVGIILAPIDNDGRICGSDDDQPVDTNAILGDFCSNVTLKNKPKVFIVQKYKHHNQQQHVNEILFPRDATDLLVCSITSSVTSSVETMPFLRQYENITKAKADSTPMVEILQESKELYENQITGLDTTFECNLYNNLSHYLVLTHNR